MVEGLLGNESLANQVATSFEEVEHVPQRVLVDRAIQKALSGPASQRSKGVVLIRDPAQILQIVLALLRTLLRTQRISRDDRCRGSTQCREKAGERDDRVAVHADERSPERAVPGAVVSVSASQGVTLPARATSALAHHCERGQHAKTPVTEQR